MNFHTWEFAIFFIITYALYLSISQRWQNFILLIASYLFYIYWDWRFLPIVIIATLSSYIGGIFIEHTSAWKQKLCFGASIFINLGMLIYFKYYLFLLENVTSVFNWIGYQINPPQYTILLPIGISYFTFQTMSYVIDIYRKQIKPTKNIIDYALFVSFFPQILAGPIERASSLLPQLQSSRIIDRCQFHEALFLIYLGLFKKLFIADNLGILQQIYSNPDQLVSGTNNGGLVLLSGYAFLFQLYCDFSSYTDIARGVAKLMGIELMENFKTPFFASNIQDTWARWHISLTTWMRDYFYYPLALMRFNKFQLNNTSIIIIVFILIGLWHGATWTFVVWGAYHGLLLAIYALLKKYLTKFNLKLNIWQKKVFTGLSIIFTFHLSVLGALFFKAPSFIYIIQWLKLLMMDFTLNAEMIEFMFKIGFHIVPLVVFELIVFIKQDHLWIWKLHPWLQYTIYYGIFYLLIVYGATTPSTYIYFQF